MGALRVEPLRRWPGELTVSRRMSVFKANYSSTLDLLWRELDAVTAAAVVCQLAIDDSDIKLDGALRANYKTEHPGVVLTFNAARLGKVRFVCDRFLNWQDNLRAIALGMEALRKIDRYGITSDGEQYAGFRALEAAQEARGFETPEAAVRYIVTVALDGADDYVVDQIADACGVDADLVDVYYRKAARIAHPDAGGSDLVMARLNAARAMIDEGAP